MADQEASTILAEQRQRWTYKRHSGHGVGWSEYLLRRDWDGDGKADIAVIHYLSKTITVLRGKGDGTFKPNVDSTNGAMKRTTDGQGGLEW